MSHKFTRLELYQLVWSEPLRKLAKPFGISDVAIAKRCRKSNIPLPGLGYWAKKEAGKQVFQPAFPPRGLGQSDVVTIGGTERYGWGREESDEELLAATITPPPPFSGGLPEVTARAQQSGLFRRSSLLGLYGGGGRNRTGVHGFAGRCMTTLPPRR